MTAGELQAHHPGQHVSQKPDGKRHVANCISDLGQFFTAAAAFHRVNA
jgi:hypothetical protein